MNEQPEKNQPDITPESTSEVPAVSDTERTSEVPAVSSIENIADSMLISRIPRPPEAQAAANAAAENVSEMVASAETDADSTSEVPAVSSAASAPNNATQSRLNNMMTSTRARLQLTHGPEWREVVYTPEIDSLLATLALENDEPPVSEAAARAIGRIRSEAAVKVLAEHQRKGERRALRALALVRDEAPSLPKSVSRQARLYTWLANTWRRLSERPLQLILRYICAAIFGALAMGFYAYVEYRSGARGLEIQMVLDIWGKTLTNSIAFGVVFGLVVLLSAEIPERLRGFWPWWARLALNLVLGIATGTMIWIVFNLFFLFNMVQPGDTNILVGGLCIAIGFVPSTLFRLPGWLAALWTGVMFAASLTITFYNFMPPLIYILPDQTIEQFAIPMGILVGIGSHLPQLIRDARAALRRVRTAPAAPSAEAPVAAAT